MTIFMLCVFFATIILMTAGATRHLSICVIYVFLGGLLMGIIHITAFNEGKKIVTCPSIENTVKTECPACPKSILLKDEEMNALPVGEIIKTGNVAQVGEKFVAILRLPNGDTKAYELSQKPPRIFIKADKGEYLKLPGL